LFPGQRVDEFLGQPTQSQIDALVGDRDRMAAIRERLSTPSWFMRALSELIARLQIVSDSVVWERRAEYGRMALGLCRGWCCALQHCFGVEGSRIDAEWRAWRPALRLSRLANGCQGLRRLRMCWWSSLPSACGGFPPQLYRYPLKSQMDPQNPDGPKVLCCLATS
jgi:hypothetical protein